MQAVKIIVTGPFGAGKTEFIRSVSENTETVAAMDFGYITVDENLVLYLLGAPGQKRFNFLWEILSEGMLGFIVMVDSTRPETFHETRLILETFRAYAPVPYIVAANKQDEKDAWEWEDIRHVLRLGSKVKCLPCVATDKETVKNVLLELLYALDKSPENMYNVINN